MANWWDDPAFGQPDVQQQQAADFTGSQDDAWGHALDVITNAIGRGAATALPYLADVASLNSRVATPEKVKQDLTGGGPAAQWASQQYDNIVGPDEPAINNYEKYGKAAGMTLGASAVPLGELMGPRAVLGGVTSGLAAQAASDEFPGNWWAPLAAGLFGAVGPHIITEGAKGVATTRMLQAGADHPAFADTVNTIIGLEGGGTLENPLTSKKGAMGIMQVMPATARDPGFGIRPWDGKSQSDLERVGMQYAAALTKKYDGDQAKILAAYNGGFGKVDKMVRQYGDDWLNHMPSETIHYVNKGLGGRVEGPGAPQVAENVPAAPTPGPISSIGQTLKALWQDQSGSLNGDEDKQEPHINPYDQGLTGINLKLPEDYSDEEWKKLNPKTQDASIKWAQESQKFIDAGQHKSVEDAQKAGLNYLNLTSKDKYQMTPAEEKAFHGAEEDPTDYSYEEEFGYHPEEEEYFGPETPAPHYDYLSAQQEPYAKFAEQHGLAVSPTVKQAIEDIATQHGVHPFDVAEAHLFDDHSTGFNPEEIHKLVNKNVKFLNSIGYDHEPEPEYDEPQAVPVGNIEHHFYAPYTDEGNYVGIEDYEGTKGQLGPLTKEAIKAYADFTGKHIQSVASHALSKSGDPAVKEAVNGIRDDLAKEQMTPKEYAAFQKLPTNDPKVLKILKKFLPQEVIPEKPTSKLAKASDAFLRMLKNDSGNGVAPDIVHAAVTEWNKGTHYLMKGPDGKPLRIYHGTSINYEGMPSGEKNRMPHGYVLFSTDPEFASDYAKFYKGDVHAMYGNKASRVFPAYIKNDPAIADFRKPEDLAKAVKWYKDHGKWGGPFTEKDLARGAWDMWERPEMLRDLGWKGAFMTEGRGDAGPSVNVMLEDHLVKSPFDPETYQNKTLGHIMVRALHGVLKDDTSALQVPESKVNESGPLARFGQNFKAMLQDESGSLNGDEEPAREPDNKMTADQKLAQAIKNFKPLTKEQAALRGQDLSDIASNLHRVQQAGGDIEAQRKIAGAQRSKVMFQSIAHNFTPEDKNTFKDMINNAPGLLPFEKFKALSAFDKMLDPEVSYLPNPSEIKLLSRVLGGNTTFALEKAGVKPPPKVGILGQIWNTVNAAKTIGDWSDLTKSNATMFLTPGYWKAIGTFAKGGLFTEKGYMAARTALREHPDYNYVNAMGISHTGEAEALGQHEEIFKQNLLQHVPVLKSVMGASERVYSGVANIVRDHAALKMIERDRAAGIDVNDPKYLKAAGDLVNTLTGRGAFGGTKIGNAFEAGMPFISKVLWTPRQYASWVKMSAQAINPKWWWNASPAMRRLMASGVISLAGWTTANLAIASSLGYEVHKNVLDPLFGKYKIGDTLYDASAGRGSTIHTIATAADQLIHGGIKGNRGQIKTAGDTVMHWMRTHASPAAALIENQFEGKDPQHPVNAIGKTQDWAAHDRTNPLADSMTPMSLEGTLDAASHYGWNSPQTWETGAGEMLGRQATTVEPREPSTSSNHKTPKEWWKDDAFGGSSTPFKSKREKAWWKDPAFNGN